MGATVVLAGTGRSAVTDSAGRYMMEGIPDGLRLAAFNPPLLDSPGAFPSAPGKRGTGAVASLWRDRHPTVHRGAARIPSIEQEEEVLLEADAQDQQHDRGSEAERKAWPAAQAAAILDVTRSGATALQSAAVLEGGFHAHSGARCARASNWG